MSDYYFINRRVDAKAWAELEKAAERRGTSVDCLVDEALAKILEQTEPFRVAAPEDVRYIVFQGLPKNFHVNLEQAEIYARKQAESTCESYTIMCVHKNSLEIALTAVYHGVKIHAMSRVIEDQES